MTEPPNALEDDFYQVCQPSKCKYNIVLVFLYIYVADAADKYAHPVYSMDSLLLFIFLSLYPWNKSQQLCILQSESSVVLLMNIPVLLFCIKLNWSVFSIFIQITAIIPHINLTFNIILNKYFALDFDHENYESRMFNFYNYERSESYVG